MNAKRSFTKLAFAASVLVLAAITNGCGSKSPTEPDTNVFTPPPASTSQSISVSSTEPTFCGSKLQPGVSYSYAVEGKAANSGMRARAVVSITGTGYKAPMANITLDANGNFTATVTFTPDGPGELQFVAAELVDGQGLSYASAPGKDCKSPVG